MTYEFDAATALTPTGDGDRFEANVTDDWRIGEAVNGGMVMSLLAAAATARDDVTETPHVLTLAAVFASPTGSGSAFLDTELLRKGRRMSTVQAVMSQDGSERARALLTLSSLANHEEPQRVSTPMPDLPAIEDCVSSQDAPRGALTSSSFLHRVDLRLDPSTAGWALGRPSGKGTMRGWFNFADGRPLDSSALWLVLDGFPPTSFDLGILGWAPTVEFTGYVYAEPAPGPLAVELTTGHAAGGLVEENARVWDSTGQQVASSRQLAAPRM